ncbi:MAG: UDP-glucose 4-epimerase GalE [Thermoleophilaceae bacterium]|nr:UDP-glucose 4-epimerase GalE [Thermoleophilaceae bacterium]
MTWLVTGGAGYIGSHIVESFMHAGTPVAVFDDLSTGYRSFVPDDVPLVKGSITDPEAVGRALDEHAITGIVHLAGWKYAGVSVQRPLHFYGENVTGMQVLLAQASERGVNRFVLSSSASWYGTPDAEIVTEDAPPRPESPYGETKVISEWLLRDLARINPDLRQTSLRYFNVVGSGPPELADHSPHNLFPKVFRAVTAGEQPVVFGDGYPTPDGSCVRDYVHVVDLADAHVTAARLLDEGGNCAPAYNVGRGEGSSVFEVLDAIRSVTGIDFENDVQPRRPGDPARIVGSAELIARDMDWRAEFGLDAMASSAWAAWQRQLELYGGPPPDGGFGLIA